MGEVEMRKGNFCCHCLLKSDETKLQSYEFKNVTINNVFQVQTLTLCYVCKRRAQQLEAFIENVQTNQILLENLQILPTSTQRFKDQNHLVTYLNSVVLDDLDVYVFRESDDLKVKRNDQYKVKVELQLKEEGSQDDHGDSDVDFNNEPLDSNIKEEHLDEDEYPLKKLKEELALEGIQMECKNIPVKNGMKKEKYRKKASSKDVSNTEKNSETDFYIETICISREQCMQERIALASEKKYLDATYKCDDCVKGFTIKDIYDKHMERHSEKKGEFECDICKQRFSTEDKLNLHQRYHKMRYRCTLCGLTRVAQCTIKDHYTALHCDGAYQFPCNQCGKSFKRHTSLRKHILYAHSAPQRAQCGYCEKTYASKEALKTHLTKKHPSQVSTGAPRARHACAECGACFPAPSLLRKHAVKHSQLREHYCVECDKSFKSEAILKQHLKTAMPHMNYSELPFPCLHCDKRFVIKRDLARHTNRVHLNIKPYQCDKCARAYINAWSLREHSRLAHEGYKRPLKFPCPMCDKVFDRNQTLKSHIRTHTGERPYQCALCPAQFSQSSVLGTHMKLIHLRLTRDGRPKAGNTYK